MYNYYTKVKEKPPNIIFPKKKRGRGKAGRGQPPPHPLKTSKTGFIVFLFAQ
jgi:hypothetical protein